MSKTLLVNRAVKRSSKLPEWVVTNFWRLVIIVVTVSAWEYLPRIMWLRDISPVFNPFFVSSPSRIVTALVSWSNDAQGTFWPYLIQTLKATVIGVSIGTSGGALLGLVLSNSPRLTQVLRPFITMMNATPRIALVPIFVILAGPTLAASVLVCVAVVFFIAFYNALAGGHAVPNAAVQNAELLGATSFEILREVRLPYVLVWTFASLPNAISFGLISVVTAEILTGSGGMGRLLSISIQTVDSTLTFMVVIILTIVGVTIITGSDYIQKRVLHWWTASP